MTGLTPAQRRKQNRETRRAQNGLWAETMGPVPYHLSQGCAALGSNTGACVQEKIDRAPAHMVDTDAFTIDQTKQVALSAKASACRTDERAQRIAEIRSDLPHLWGIRGKAGEVAEEWFKRSGELLSARTIQDYFQSTRT